MLKVRFAVFRRRMILFDLCMIAASFFLGYWLRNKIHAIYPLSDYLRFLPVLLFVWGGLLYYFEVHSSFRMKQVSQILSPVFKSALGGLIIFGSFIYLFRVPHVSRGFIFSVFILGVVFISIEKIILASFFRYTCKKGVNLQNILIVGTGKRVGKFVELVHSRREWGLNIVGLIDKDLLRKGKKFYGYEVLGGFDDAERIIHQNIVDELVFIVPRSWLKEIEEIIHLCEIEGVAVNIAVDYFDLKFYQATQINLEGFPLLSFNARNNPRIQPWPILEKRLADIFISGVALLVLAPLFAIITVIIKFTSPGPVFFRQKRCGLYGRQFTLYKFRTMVENAEKKLAPLLKYNQMRGPAFKIANDPRLTKVGRFLRKFSLDELPQLWNVFKGDMHLVGPRPPLPCEVEKYESWQRKRLSVIPGLTGLWQINGRSKIADFNDWLKWDFEYIDNWSFWLDFKILLKTGVIVLWGIGAE